MRTTLEDVEAFRFRVKDGLKLGATHMAITVTTQLGANFPSAAFLTPSAGAQGVKLPAIQYDGQTHFIANTDGTYALTVVSHADDGADAVATISAGNAVLLCASLPDQKWYVVAT